MARKRKYKAQKAEDLGFYTMDAIEELCENDAISGAEEGFMLGYLNA